MWIIVAVSLTLGDAPKLSVVPGAEYQTEAECARAVQVKAQFDTRGGGIDFGICMPKDSVQIGK